jgi:putative membrane protein
MGQAKFLSEGAKRGLSGAIEAVEQESSVELVVAVRRESGCYRHADYLVGLAVLMAALLVILFAEHTFALEAIPVELLAAFAVGSAIGSRVGPLRRLLTSRTTRDHAVRTAARAAFHDLGVSRTKARTGLLVFLSVFERAVDVVPDIGLDVSALPAGWDAPVRKAASKGDVDAVIKALRDLAPVLGTAYPRAADDVNELADEVTAE